MFKYLPIDLRPQIVICLALLLSGICQAQTDPQPTEDAAKRWKTSTLAQIDLQLGLKTIREEEIGELRARQAWLTDWNFGGMTAKPKQNSSLPKTRSEPIFESDLAAKIRKTVVMKTTENDNSIFAMLNQALADQPDDIALQQLRLQWMDHPVRRKSYLPQIESQTVRLLQMLKLRMETDESIRLAFEFAMYRRGRALAYRELPDVVKLVPIEDPKRLNQQILSAYNDLIDSAGSGRSEFILLEIRMLRRGKSFGTALSKLENYGSLIKPQWYLKKRRDLLQELEWEIPYLEAAAIYAAEFPEEVAKELAQKAEASGS